ncbi:MAG: Trp biosynthesis-associated membrane protein [Mycobacteriales bacterium]
MSAADQTVTDDAEGVRAESREPGHPKNVRSDARIRAELGLAVLLSVIAGAVVLFACSRQWWMEQTARPAPLPPLSESTHGKDVTPWGAGMGFVGLSGGAALLATRGRGRAIVGVILLLSGVIVGAGGLLGLTSRPGEGVEHVDVAVVWPVLTVASGVLLILAGGWSVLRFRSWRSRHTGMSSRYEAPSTNRLRSDRITDSAALWDSLDRGVDPTAEDGPKAGGDGGVK